MRPSFRYILAAIAFLNAAILILMFFDGLDLGFTYHAAVLMAQAIGFACIGIGFVNLDRKRLVLYVGLAILVCTEIADK